MILLLTADNHRHGGRVPKKTIAKPFCVQVGKITTICNYRFFWVLLPLFWACLALNKFKHEYGHSKFFRQVKCNK
jgi:hypothetical protein